MSSKAEKWMSEEFIKREDRKSRQIGYRQRSNYLSVVDMQGKINKDYKFFLIRIYPNSLAPFGEQDVEDVSGDKNGYII